MRTTSSSFFIVFCLAIVIGLAGCKSERTAENTGQRIDKAVESTGQKIEKTGEAVANQAEKAVDYMDDAAITAKVKTDILSDPLLKVSQIEVTTTNGVVRLSGKVDSSQSLDRAVEITRSIKDVKSVDVALVH